MKKLLAFLALIAITYPSTAMARELVEVSTSTDGTKTYVWRDTIRRANNFVWWTEEHILYGAAGKLNTHDIVDYSGDCSQGIYRILKDKNVLTGRVNATPDAQSEIVTPGSVGETVLNYVCGKN